MSVLFCNIGWMEKYQGQRSGDKIRGGGSYVKSEGRGHEMCNFSADGGILHGYVQPSGGTINIERLGAQQNDDLISGITVIWTATRPTGGTAVVGWYKNATVFRHYQTFSKMPPAHKRNEIDGYRISAPADQAVLLEVDQRTCEIPRQVKGGMGQSNVWYADSEESVPYVKEILSFVNGKRGVQAGKGKRSSRQDQERKALIEKSAINTCCRHFESLGYEVESVERDNLGWDLKAVSGKSELRIEVKGLSGSEFSIELTPNEYKAFILESDSYRLAVVTDALDKPLLHICRFSGELGGWIVEGAKEGTLMIAEKVSAIVRFS
jgi:hypothetical protein